MTCRRKPRSLKKQNGDPKIAVLIFVAI